MPGTHCWAALSERITLEQGYLIPQNARRAQQAIIALPWGFRHQQVVAVLGTIATMVLISLCLPVGILVRVESAQLETIAQRDHPILFSARQVLTRLIRDRQHAQHAQLARIAPSVHRICRLLFAPRVTTALLALKVQRNTPARLVHSTM